MGKAYETSDENYDVTDSSEAQILEDILERKHKKNKPKNRYNESNNDDLNVPLYSMMNSVTQ